MNNLLYGKIQELSSASSSYRPTSAKLSPEAVKNLGTHPYINYRNFMVHSSSTDTGVTANWNLLATLESTTSGVTIPSTPTSSPEVTQKAINDLRRLSGLTWYQLSRIFNVSRRSLHSWASGERLKPFNEETLNRLLGTIKYIDRGSANLNRSLLLQPNNDGRTLLDLLRAGEHEAVKRILGPGNASEKPKLGSLSEDARLSRLPVNPADLVDALQDTIHQEVGRSRPARTARSRKK